MNFPEPGSEASSGSDELEEFKNPRDRAIIPLVRLYKDHPVVRRKVNKYRKPDHHATKSPHDMTGRYLQEAGEFRLLDAVDEQELFAAIEKGIQIKEMLDISGNAPTPEEEQLLIELVAARQVLYSCNLRLVINEAKKLAGYNTFPLLDLIQEGNIGLSTAICRNDYTRGLKFSTYATNWVRQRMTRAIADKGRLIRMPVHLHEEWLKYNKEKQKLTNKLERDPTIEELIEATGRTRKQIMTFWTFGQIDSNSLDAALEEDGEGLINRLPDGAGWTADSFVDDIEQSEDIQRIFNGPLTEREKLVVSLRFGVFREELNVFEFGEQSYEEVILEGAKTLDDIGKLLGVTRERIRQIEKKAMDIIRDRVF